jgi:hypothetical protein
MQRLKGMPLNKFATRVLHGLDDSLGEPRWRLKSAPAYEHRQSILSLRTTPLVYSAACPIIPSGSIIAIPH